MHQLFDAIHTTTRILNLCITGGGPAITIVYCECITSGYFALSVAAFMPDPGNMRAAKGFKGIQIGMLLRNSR